MSGLPFGVFKKQKQPSFISEASEQQIEAFLAQKEYFDCKLQNCRMQEKSCIRNQQISREATKVGSREIYRDSCLNCKQGAAVAKKHKVVLKAKEAHKCPRCGKVVSHKALTSYTCMDCRVELNRERLIDLEAGNTRKQIFEAIA